MNKILLTALAACFALLSFGQNSFHRNDIYFEAGGSGLFGSINYERQLTKAPGLGARIGVGIYSENAFYLTIPVGINYLFELKRQNKFIDAGMSATWARQDARLFDNNHTVEHNHFFSFIPSIGYRVHTNRNVMWRISLAPVINKFGFVPWLGFSIGKRF